MQLCYWYVPMMRPWCLWYFMSHWKWFKPLQVQANCQYFTCPRVVVWSLQIAYFYFELSGILLMRNPGLRRRNSWLAPMITDVISPGSRTFERSTNVWNLSLRATNQPFRFVVLISVNLEFFLKMLFPWCYKMLKTKVVSAKSNYRCWQKIYLTFS